MMQVVMAAARIGASKIMTYSQLAAGAFFFLTLAKAGALVSTGFESPGYSVGTLSGQQGWTNNGTGTVESTFAFAGSQAVEYTDNTTGQFNLDELSIPGTSSGILTVSDEFYITSGGAIDQEFWYPLDVLGSSINTDVRFEVTGPFLVFLNSGSPFESETTSVTDDSWILLTAVLNFGTGMASGYVNGTLLGTVSMNGLTSAQDFAMGYSSTGSTGDQMFVDNLSINSTPEPPTWTLAVLGSCFLALGLAGALVKRSDDGDAV
jgi:hypothetical protein